MSSSVDSTSSLNRTADPNKTSRGTRIVQPGADMDKNAFLRILTAELSNQDPDNAKDSTQYVAQMAQFSSLEQMANLNTNIEMSSANAMIGKSVYLRTLNSNGDQYSGILRAVSKQGSAVKIGLEVDNNGTKDIEEFSFDDVIGVSDNPDDATYVNKDAMNILAISSMIGKRAEFNIKDTNGENYVGLINGIVKNKDTFDLSVLLDGTGETKKFDLASLLSLLTAK